MQANNTEKKLPIIELFGPTIEGEGKLIGKQTFFIRFGLCDYKCRRCDSMHAVDPNLVKALAAWKTQEEIFAALKEHAKSMNAEHIKNVTFSGGNPAIHDLSDLCHLLVQDGWKIFVETQGTKHPAWFSLCNEIVCSPKSPGMGEVFEPEVFREFVNDISANGVSLSIKIVVFSAQDLEFAAGVFDLARQAYRDGLLQSYRDVVDADILTSIWERDSFFLSLGNPYPPQFGFTGEVKDGKLEVAQGFDYPEFSQENNQESTTKNTLAEVLLNQYNKLCEEILHDQRLANVRFLPQLHVLVYGNETGR